MKLLRWIWFPTWCRVGRDIVPCVRVFGRWNILFGRWNIR